MSSEVHTVDHVVIGSGFAGLAAAIGLEEDGERDFVVLEKASDLGGTWRDNTYPGATCDVPSQLYSYSFAPYDWPRSYSPQPDIQAYVKQVAERSGTLDRFVFDAPAEDMRWDDAARRWTIRTPRGTWTSKTLIVAAGGLSEPKLPDIDGLETFQGHVFHSARWDHSVDLTGLRVAVVGTGASAIQIIPELQEVVGHLDVYQRTAPWVIARNDRVYSRLERAALQRVPGLRTLYRAGLYWSHEALVPALTLEPRLGAPVQRQAAKNIERGIADPELRRKVTPTFRLFCKRILRSNDYYPALAADNVELVTDPIAKVTGSGVVTADGTEREIDVLVVATGFHTTELPVTEHITGRSGQTLADRWRASGMAAYKGTTVPDFPNLFMLVGPNTGQGHTSMIHIIESQVTYVRDALRRMRRDGVATLEPTEQATAAFNRALQKRMRRTVWTTGGCSSWYLDEHGRNTTLWPRSTADFRRRLASYDPESYLEAAQ
ncbi:NAD(P)/FAD-dependent oxidoreductase [Nocardioides anomalus]|uniref:NAD(P)/FAD-dependent oxidoreductase n=1 Tax=Nocardioides anomalus TaxID=2712223 RepID=A0A6G6W8N9_9ACTN|nr:NAD(P)/FAD-dependent oxidoreductase [Nocardioides anomalus]QIG41582.1 NAD(P)/FAD-dependent oxidoreductase [Nocardioides anomalus]